MLSTVAQNGGLLVSDGMNKNDDEKEKIKMEDPSLVCMRNPNIDLTKGDILYHFAISTNTHDLEEMFGDVKFVLVGGSPRRMEVVTTFMAKALNHKLPAGQSLSNISSATDRFAMYKVGPVLSVSHGMGIGSFSIMMHELIKLLHYAKVVDVRMFRLGTSGGIGVEPGTVVVSTNTVDALFRPYLEMPVLGKITKRPAQLDKQLVIELVNCSRSDDDFRIVAATTMCTLDFYEGQARMDGAFCDFTTSEKMDYLHEAYNLGVRNIEMESLCFAAMCTQANIKGAVICVTLLDRLEDDQVRASRETLKLYEERPAIVVARLLRRRLLLDK